MAWAVAVVLHVRQCLQTCCRGVFIIASYCSTIQIFRLIAGSVTNLLAQMCPYNEI